MENKPLTVNQVLEIAKFLANKGELDQAVQLYRAVLEKFPDHTQAHNNLGSVFMRLGKSKEAEASYANAVRIEPDNARLHNNLGNALFGNGKSEAAIASYTKAVQLMPRYAGAHYNLGNAFMILGRHEEAIASFSNTVQIQPDNADAKAQKLYQQAQICDWPGLGSEYSAISTLGITGAAVSPFCFLSFEDHPARHRKRSETYAANNYNHAALPEIKRPARKPDRIRIGYFSGNFRDHPGMQLMARMFELHDRSEFQIHAYSFGPPSSSPMRARVEKSFDVFRDVRTLSEKQIAELARDDKIDIAIDRSGYTINARTGIFAYRAAPIQINYLAYPSTMGVPFIDYIVADKMLIPEESRKFYSEKVVYLPHSYMVNDNTKQIAEETPARADVGLPETGFVFCCFNNTYKISPAEFDIWMRLLHKVDGSVLWLLKANPTAEKNLLREAKSRGIDPERLVFAERMPLPEHLARHRLANLFLDTFNYNAHTTASDALWTGLPVLTKLGEGFAARVAGSLLNAIDLPELITASEAAYENLALELATDPQKLQAIKEKLHANRNTKPLFDTELFTQHLEQAYRRVYDRYFEGAKPEHIVIGEGVK